MILIGKARICLALPCWKKRDNLAQVDVEERQHMRYMNVWDLSWLGNQGKWC